MSQSDAEISKLVVGLAKCTSLSSKRETEKWGDRALVYPQNGPDAKGHMAEKVTGGPEIVKELAKNDADDVKEEDVPEAYIKFLFDPEVFEVVLNEYVINEIAKYVDYQDLKSIRRVNKLWSIGAKRQFVQNSAFALVSRKRNESQLVAFGSETENLKGMTALRIRLSHGFGFEKEAEIFGDILATLAPTLNALELQHWTDDVIFRLRNPIQFPALSVLTLESDFFDRVGGRRIFKFLYPSAPNITKLVISNCNPDLNFLSPLMTHKGYRNWSLVPKLSSLGMHYDNNKPQQLMNLVKFPQSWESLDISLSADSDTELKALFRLLEKNKESLVSLKLDIDDISFFSLRNPRQLYTFPAKFSKLEKLELDFAFLYCNINFGGSALNFSKTIPKLKWLSVRLPRREETATEIWASLFPPQVFRGLKYLKVLWMCSITFPNDQEISQDWAQKMFPNAKIEID